MSSTAVASELTCKELVELVTDYFEDRLPTEVNARLELHVCACTGCRVYLKQMWALLRAAGRIAEGDILAPARDDLLRAFREWKRRSAP